MTLQVGRYRHYLGPWNPAERVRVAPGADGLASGLPWRAPDANELGELRVEEPLGEIASEPVLGAMTVPRKIRRELWELEWDDASGAMTPRDRDAFDAYGRRVVGFLRAAGLAAGSESRDMKLVASAPGVTEGSNGEGTVTLVNVGESPCWVAVRGPAGAVALVVPPDEGCVVSGAARPWSLVVPAEVEFGLVLEVG